MNATTEAGGEGMAAGQQLASAAAAQAGQVSQQAADQAKHIAGTAVEQTRQVGQEAATQARTVIGETKDKAHQQAEVQTQQVAQALERLGYQARALLAGRPEEAESLPQYADSAVSRLEELTRRVQDGGFDGVMADVQGFARRRPGLFLLGAAAVGFGMGRMLRAGAAHPSRTKCRRSIRPLHWRPRRPLARWQRRSAILRSPRARHLRRLALRSGDRYEHY